MDESTSKTRRLQSMTTNTNTPDSRMHTPVDSFVQLNLKPAIDIKLEDYKKVKDIFNSNFFAIGFHLFIDKAFSHVSYIHIN